MLRVKSSPPEGVLAFNAFASKHGIRESKAAIFSPPRALRSDDARVARQRSPILRQTIVSIATGFGFVL